MTHLDTVARWLDRAVYPLLAALLIGPAFFIPRFVHESVKIGTELYIVTLAWVVIGMIGLAGALLGRPFLTAGVSSNFHKVMIAFTVWLMVSGLWSEQPAVHYGYAASVVTFLLAAQSVWTWMERRAGRKNFVFALVCGLLASEVAIGFAQYYKVLSKDLFKYVEPGGLLDGWLIGVGARASKGNIFGTVGNPNYLAELLALLIPLAAAWAAARTKRVGQIVLVPVVLSALFLLFAVSSRAAILGVVGGVAVAAVALSVWRAFDVRTWWGDTRKRAAMIVGVVAIIAVAGVAGGKLANKFGGTFENDYSVESRLVNWRAGAALWLEKPVQGHGLGGWKRESIEKLATQHPNGLPESSSTSRFLQLHNEPLQGLVELGLFGALLALAALLLWLREVRRNESLPLWERFGVVAAVAALLIAAEFGFPLHIPLTALMFVIIVVLGVTRAPSDEIEAVSTGSLTSMQRVAYALAILVLTGGVAKLSIDRGAGAAYQANYYELLGNDVHKRDKKSKGPAVLHAYAAEIDRFKAIHVFSAMTALSLEGRNAEVVAMYDRYANDSLAMGSRLLRARALEKLGRKDEAIVDYQRVARFYHRSEKNYRLAYRYLKKHGIDIPPPVRRTPQGTAAAKPAPAASPVAATATGQQDDDDATDVTSDDDASKAGDGDATDAGSDGATDADKDANASN